MIRVIGTIALTTLLAEVATPTSVNSAAMAPVAPFAKVERHAGAGPSPVVRVDRGSDGLFRIEAHVKGKPTSFIVDTGATNTVLTGRDASRLGIDVGAHGATTMMTAGGPSEMRWAKVDDLEVAGIRLPPLYVAVVESGLEHSLLGQEVLSRLGAITIDRDRLEVSQSLNG